MKRDFFVALKVRVTANAFACYAGPPLVHRSFIKKVANDFNAPTSKKAIEEFKDRRAVTIELCDEMSHKLHRNKMNGLFFVDKVLHLSHVGGS